MSAPIVLGIDPGLRTAWHASDGTHGVRTFTTDGDDGRLAWLMMGWMADLLDSTGAGLA